MKKQLLALAILLPLAANAMKIETDEIDEFTEERIVMTSWEPVCGGKVNIRFRHQFNKDFLDFKYYYDSAIVIGEDCKLFVKGTDDHKTMFSSAGTYSGERGAAATGYAGSAAWGIFAIYTGNIDWFSDHCAKLIRLYTTDSYIDLKLSEKNGNKLAQLVLLFRSALNNDDSYKVVTCTMKFLRKRKKSNKWEVVSEDFVEDELYNVVQQKADEWKSKTSDTYDYDVQIVKGRR